MMLAQRTTTACSGRRAASSSAFKSPRLLRAAAVSPKQQQCAEVNPALSLALASALVSTPLAAWADDTAAAPVEAAAEGAQQAAAAVTEAAAEAAPAPQWVSYIIVLTPIILYGLFNVYRNQVNPRASFSDFLFLVAGVAVIANLVSIIGFKVRLF